MRDGLLVPRSNHYQRFAGHVDAIREMLALIEAQKPMAQTTTPS